MIKQITLTVTAFTLLLAQLVSAQKSSPESKYIFFLHNRYVQLFDLDVPHPEFGKAEYLEIIDKFRQSGFIVLSEKRPKNTDIKEYARKIGSQVDSLLQIGVKPENITIIGTSFGGYIAQYVSTNLKNHRLNFVLIGCYTDNDLHSMPEIQLCGNILSIYEKSDTLGVCMKKRIGTSKNKIPHFKEIELHTNNKHGFLYHPMDEWILPAIQWAKGLYKLKTD